MDPPLMIQRPSRRTARPRALDISFPEEDYDPYESTATSDASRKRDRRDGGGDADIRGAKRRNLDSIPQPERKYEPRSYEVKETKDLLVFGEEPNPPNDDKKRARVLSRFTFFDARTLVMVSLDALDGRTDDDGPISAAGFAVAKFEQDDLEDEGQEDDGFDFDVERRYIRIPKVLKFFTRYWERDSPFYIETKHAIYELDFGNPSKKYRTQFSPFCKLENTLRFVISSAKTDPEQEINAFMKEYGGEENEVLGERLTQSDLWAIVPKLPKILERVPYGDQIRASNIVRHLLSSRVPPTKFKLVGEVMSKKKQVPKSDFTLEIKGSGDIDLTALRWRVPTHITPRIERLARPLFREELHVVGPRPRAEPEVPREQLSNRLQEFLFRTQTRRLVQFRPDQRIRHTRFLNHILIDGLKYEVGDTVLFFPKRQDGIEPDLHNLPPTDTLADHFWFGRIIYMEEEYDTVHVQWFEHSSKILVQELGHPQELFLVNQCDKVPLKLIVGKIKTHYLQPDQSLVEVPSHDYFYRYMWDVCGGRLFDIDMAAQAAAAQEPPGHNCPACHSHDRFETAVEPTKIHLGVSHREIDYHLDDCVRIKANEGPCHIGHIISFASKRNSDFDVVVRLFGRTDRLGCRPETVLKDERHLFYTNDEMTVPISNLIGICYVVVKDDMPELDDWLSMSPYRFYIKYRFPSLGVLSWNNKRRMRWDDLPVCPKCFRQDLMKFKGMKSFLENEPPLRVFDPFGGIGALGLAMEEMGCFKLTHAVEISPSASKTLKNASPHTKVYNQCSNLILKQAILTHENKNPKPLKSIEDRPLPPPPKPGEIDCVIAGFPCQPHSTLNMFQRANDNKSSLILTALSWVDHLKPPYCIFENVRGFLRYNLLARQDGIYTVKGGIPMGGLKLIVAAMIDMGYQVRCGLLQAAHYGTPQTRVRFFLLAAKRGLELPQFPQPTHDFPVLDELEIKIPGGICISPITTLPGVAPHRYVSVHDAISDLPKFDWKDPKENLTVRQMEEKGVKDCREDANWCGYQGPSVQYEHPPRTRFQKQCRSRPTRDIQHYTRTYDAKKVERIIEIPVDPEADYRSLPSHLWEYQFANPASSVGKRGYRPGYYGRVQLDKWFQTTVTNIDPMAKQCRVIHPLSRRIVTVRELARSQGIPDAVVFHAENNRVKTMHRQIGNAVPWPLSMAIAREFRETLYRKWEAQNPVEEIPDATFSGPESDDAMDMDGDR